MLATRRASIETARGGRRARCAPNGIPRGRSCVRVGDGRPTQADRGISAWSAGADHSASGRSFLSNWGSAARSVLVGRDLAGWPAVAVRFVLRERLVRVRHVRLAFVLLMALDSAGLNSPFNNNEVLRINKRSNV